jgi:two-component system, NtrC family, sensor kinase
VEARTRELRLAQAQLVAAARRAGMAEVANNVLHNVGNVLNSVNTSAGLIAERVHASRSQGLAKAVALMKEQGSDLARFIAHDERGAALPGYLDSVSAALLEERDEVISELRRLMASIDHINTVVAKQQSHAGLASVREIEQVDDLLETALRMNADGIERNRIAVVRQFGSIAPMPLDRPRVLQILVNLIGNAAKAMQGRPGDAGSITLQSSIVEAETGPSLRIRVGDEGEGIAPDNLTRIFAHGFTTRKDGHGFGLHSSAVAAMEMGGTLRAHSDGPGRGAVFTLELPLSASATRSPT